MEGSYGQRIIARSCNASNLRVLSEYDGLYRLRRGAGFFPLTIARYVLHPAHHRAARSRRPAAHHRAKHAGADAFTGPYTRSDRRTRVSPHAHAATDLHTHPGLYAYAGTNSYSHTYPRADLYTRAHVHAGTDLHTHSNTHAYAYTRADLYTRAHIYAGTDLHTCTVANGHAVPYAHPGALTVPHICTDCYATGRERRLLHPRLFSG